MKVNVERFVTGPIETNTFVVSSGAAALIVDPSRGCTSVVDFCDKEKLRVEAIVLTHGHFDHIMGITELHEKYGALDVWVHADEKILITNANYNGSVMIGAEFAYTGPTKNLSEKTTKIGSFDVRVLHVPGHSPGGCALVFDGVAIVGDALFAGSIGRSDLPGGDGELLIENIKLKLLTLPPETVVYPGHGGRTTIGREKRLNMFLQQ
jgi:hydroxyacylglutathione hydrolase